MQTVLKSKRQLRKRQLCRSHSKSSAKETKDHQQKCFCNLHCRLSQIEFDYKWIISNHKNEAKEQQEQLQALRLQEVLLPGFQDTDEHVKAQDTNCWFSHMECNEFVCGILTSPGAKWASGSGSSKSWVSGFESQACDKYVIVFISFRWMLS